MLEAYGRIAAEFDELSALDELLDADSDSELEAEYFSRAEALRDELERMIRS